MQFGYAVLKFTPRDDNRVLALDDIEVIKVFIGADAKIKAESLLESLNQNILSDNFYWVQDVVKEELCVKLFTSIGENI